MKSRTLAPFRTTNLVVVRSTNGAGGSTCSEFFASGEALLIDPGCSSQVHAEVRENFIRLCSLEKPMCIHVSIFNITVLWSAFPTLDLFVLTGLFRFSEESFPYVFAAVPSTLDLYHWVLTVFFMCPYFLIVLDYFCISQHGRSSKNTKGSGRHQGQNHYETSW